MKLTLIIITGLATLTIAFYGYYGGFVKISIKESECGGETLVYEDMKGDYSQSGKVSDKVYHTLLEKHNITTYKGFGIYFDNPREVAKEDLRSMVGCILEEEDIDKVELLQADIKIRRYPATRYITAEFPMKGFPSVILGIFKVYPALQEYCNANGYSVNTPVMEIWDKPNKKIIYRKEIIKEDINN